MNLNIFIFGKGRAIVKIQNHFILFSYSERRRFKAIKLLRNISTKRIMQKVHIQPDDDFNDDQGDLYGDDRSIFE